MSASLVNQNISTQQFTANGIEYQAPNQPIAVICIDGCENDYLDVSIKKGVMPNLEMMIETGFRTSARGALPSFTNVNNACIISGMPPKVTGISGNFFLDPDSGQEVMMNDAKYFRCESILAKAADAGRQVAMVTAKDKLCGILSHELNGIVFSAEKAKEANFANHGIDNVEELVGPTPSIYSPDASIYVLQAGIELIRNRLADFCYLSLTDYMQHKFAPEEKESLDFYKRMDDAIGGLLKLNALVGITADHGMNAKNTIEGKPNIIFVEELLHKQFGQGAKVICPITDPYVVHHGALGSLVMIHLASRLQDRIDEVIDFLQLTSGITEVYSRHEAAHYLELPADRIGDITVLADRHVVLGRKPEDHALEHIEGGLRSHGGRFEETVPFILSKPLNNKYFAKSREDLRSFELFDYLCNGVVQDA